MKSVKLLLLFVLAFNSFSFAVASNEKLIIQELGGENLLKLVDKAEGAYDNNVKFCDLKKELNLLNLLYSYKDNCEVALYEFELKKNELTIADAAKIEYEYLALTKEVIRRLEVHLMDVHGWRPIRHFSSIAKPTVYGTGFTVGVIVVAKTLEMFGTISKDACNKTLIYSSAAGFALTLFWIIYNYKDVIYLRDKKKI